MNIRGCSGILVEFSDSIRPYLRSDLEHTILWEWLILLELKPYLPLSIRRCSHNQGDHRHLPPTSQAPTTEVETARRKGNRHWILFKSEERILRFRPEMQTSKSVCLKTVEATPVCCSAVFCPAYWKIQKWAYTAKSS